MTSKCGKNISDTLGCASCATFLFLSHLDVICDLLLKRCTATWNLFVNLIVRGCFDRTHGFNIYYQHLMHALRLHNYDKQSRIFSGKLFIGNHMIFLVQFGINKHLLIFSKTANCTRFTGSSNFCQSLKKFTGAYSFQIALEIM